MVGIAMLDLPKENKELASVKYTFVSKIKVFVKTFSQNLKAHLN
tara:strand:- start:60 stop:191 length:132 start_codon:yes stop_codon:yes gene_type:complete